MSSCNFSFFFFLFLDFWFCVDEPIVEEQVNSLPFWFFPPLFSEVLVGYLVHFIMMVRWVFHVCHKEGGKEEVFSHVNLGLRKCDLNGLNFTSS